MENANGTHVPHHRLEDKFVEPTRSNCPNPPAHHPGDRTNSKEGKLHPRLHRLKTQTGICFTATAILSFPLEAGHAQTEKGGAPLLGLPWRHKYMDFTRHLFFNSDLKAPAGPNGAPSNCERGAFHFDGDQAVSSGLVLRRDLVSIEKMESHHEFV